ncbi:hypothetical protein [Amycolatopsis thermoflava]|uniref:hypothetical protein n=1 Tax=Amycolatopsis thermoflava TaxID=84480 RepID=UPI0012F72BE4|nr:hypothetical protein [Amycolatopsis thermoflava]
MIRKTLAFATLAAASLLTIGTPAAQASTTSYGDVARIQTNWVWYKDYTDYNACVSQGVVSSSFGDADTYECLWYQEGGVWQLYLGYN